VREAIVPMNPDDPRLRDLAAWQPPLDAHEPQRPPAGRVEPQERRGQTARRGRRPGSGDRPWAATRQSRLRGADTRRV
jgi:hypothetical protein